MNPNILLIGAGQLGSRHLQGIARFKKPLNIVVVEPVEQNQKLAFARFQEIPNHSIHEINITDDINNIPVLLYDIAIIATNSNVRAQITQNLVSRTEVKSIIFEKVAFQSEKQFENIIQLLNEKKIKSWVNTPRRYLPIYQELKNYLKNTSVQLLSEGVDWGLACNSVHQIDLLSFITNDYLYQPDFVDLENKIYNSKRSGFIEFYGTLSGKSTKGNAFMLKCKPKSSDTEKPFQIIQLSTGTENIVIKESQCAIEYFKFNEDSPYKTENFKMLYQSDITALQIEEILNTGTCLLPDIENSFLSHKVLFTILKKQYSKITSTNIENLPIT